MARIQCRACGHDDIVDPWDGTLTCPACGSTDCRAAVRTVDLPDALWERMRAEIERMADEYPGHSDEPDPDLIGGGAEADLA